MSLQLFSGSRLRTIGEVFLAVAIIGALVYDLGLPSSGGSAPTAALTEDAMGLEWKAQLGGDHPTTRAEQATPVRLSSHYQAQVDPLIGPGNTTNICSNTTLATNPYTVGSVVPYIPKALVFSLGAGVGCNPNPYITSASSPTGLGSVAVATGSWISFQALSATGGAVMNTLTLQPGSTFEVDARGYTGNSANVLRTLAPCPSFTGVNTVISNCPGSCSLAMTNTPTGCLISYGVTGTTPVPSSKVGSITMNKDCGSYTQAQFVSDVAAATGIPASSIRITSWLCGSITALFQVLGADTASANAAVQQIINNANSGPLKNTLGVTSASVIGGPTTTTTASTTATYYHTPTTSTTSTTTTWPISVSSSNPALFALLTLLAIPLLAALGVGIWCCMKKAPEPAVITEAPMQYYPAEQPAYTYVEQPAYTYAEQPAYTYAEQPTYYAQPEPAYAYGYETATPVATPGYAMGGEPMIVPVPVAAEEYAGSYAAGATYTSAAGVAPAGAQYGAFPMSTSGVEYGAFPTATSGAQYGAFPTATSGTQYGAFPMATSGVEYGAFPTATSGAQYGTIPTTTSGAQFAQY